MDTNQIKCFSKANENIRKIFVDCLPVDYLPAKKLTVKSHPKLICTNLCSSETSGEDFSVCVGHWIGLYIEKGGVSIFDSGGYQNWSENKYVKDFVRKQGKRIFFNKHQVQPVTSDRCGVYVLSFFNAMSKGETFHKFIQKFHTVNLARNDEIIWKYFKKEFLKRKPIGKRKMCR